MSEDLSLLDATAQAELIRTGQVSATDLVTAAIERIEALNPVLNAVVTPVFERAAEQAQAGPTGPFAGVPYLVKDLACEMEGVRFTEGSVFLASHVSAFDSELVLRLRRAGLVILGKTNTPEFGMAPACEPVLFGPTRNPWDTGRSTSGSSGGSAAAVASGMVPFAHGNDLGGSLRYPASACGLFALKPTRARNPLGPEYGDVAAGGAAEHALTRSVRDSAALLDATSGPDLGDPYWAPPPDRPFGAEVGADPGRLRIGYTTRTPEGDLGHPDCVAAAEHAARLCATLGHEVAETDWPGFTSEVGAAIGTIIGAAAAWIMRYWIRHLGREPDDGEIGVGGCQHHRDAAQRYCLQNLVGDGVGDAFGAVGVGSRQRHRDLAQRICLVILVGDGVGDAFGAVGVGSRQRHRDLAQRICLVILVGDGVGDAFGAVGVGGCQRHRDLAQRICLVILVGDGVGDAFGAVGVGSCQRHRDLAQRMLL